MTVKHGWLPPSFLFKIEEAFNGQPVSRVQSGGEGGFNRVVPFCVSLPDQARRKIDGLFLALTDPPGTTERGITRSDRRRAKACRYGSRLGGHENDICWMQASCSSAWGAGQNQELWILGDKVQPVSCVVNVKDTCLDSRIGVSTISVHRTEPMG